MGYPVRFESLTGGEGKWRSVPNFEHSTLCMAFNLDPCRFYFDLPRSVMGDPRSWAGKVISGFVMHAGQDTPWGKLTICYQSEKFRDTDPMNPQDFFRL